MSSARILGRNIVSNWVGFAVNAGVSLVLTPIVVNTLGETRYGVWMIAMGVTGSYGLLDIGFRSGVNQYLTRYLSSGDEEGLNASASSAFVGLTLIGLLAFAVSLAVGFFSDRIFEAPPELSDELFAAIALTGFSASLQLATFPFSSMLMAMQRFDISNAIGIVAKLSSGVGIYLALRQGGGLVAISVVVAAANTLDYFARCLFARRLAPQLRVRPRLANWASCREILSYGGWTFFGNAAVQIQLSVAPLLIGAFMPAAAVGRYALAANLSRQLDAVLNPAAQVFFPMAVRLHARNETAALQRLLTSGTRFYSIASGLVVGTAFVFAEDFYRLWLGARYVEEPGFPSAALLFQILAVGQLARRLGGIGSNVLMACRDVKPLAALGAADGLGVLVLSAAVIPPFGLTGVAAVSCFLGVVRGAAAALLSVRRTELPLGRFLYAAYARFLAAFACFLPLAILAERLFDVDRLSELALVGLAVIACAAPLVAWLGLRQREKRALAERLRERWRRFARRHKSAPVS